MTKSDFYLEISVIYKNTDILICKRKLRILLSNYFNRVLNFSKNLRKKLKNEIIAIEIRANIPKNNPAPEPQLQSKFAFSCKPGTDTVRIPPPEKLPTPTLVTSDITM